MSRVSFRAEQARVSLIIIITVALATGTHSADRLVHAARRGDAAAIQERLMGLTDLQERDTNGNTALHWAALNGDSNLLKELLRRGAQSGVTNDAVATPLVYAVGNPESVRALLKAGAAAAVNQPTLLGTTPLVAAARYPASTEVVRLLLEAGADGPSRTSALREAAYAGDPETFTVLLNTGVRLKHVARPAMMGHYEIVEAALDAGADLKHNGGHAGHALNFALYGNQPAIAELLINRGADLTFRSPAGEHETPPILWAAYNESGDASVARLMIEKGADVNTLSALGESALDWARARNNKTLEMLLLKHGAREGTAKRKQKRIPNRELPPTPEALNSVIRRSATAAIDLLQRSSDAFLSSHVVKQQACVSCHQQTLPAVAFAWARERGLPVKEISIARQVQDQVRYWTGTRIAGAYELIRPQPDVPILLGYGLWGLAALGYPSDSLTEAMVWYLAATQRPDGSWPAADYRPPMEDGPLQGAAFAIRALQLYPLPGREPEFKQRIARAAKYLSSARATTFNQQVFQLLGLGWSGSDPDQLRPFIAAILDKQDSDGGWSQLDGLSSDAWATGQALVALNTVGSISFSNAALERGVRFLLRTQFDDGSWYVRSRAWPFQPHFESEFPHGKDQWISAGGTAWAAMALLLTQPKTQSTPAREWLAMKVPNEKPAARPAAEARKRESTESKVNFARDIAPVLERSCAGCHGGKTKRGSFSIASREALLEGGQSGEPAVDLGNSGHSRLIQMITDKVEDLEMPPLSKRAKYPALNENEVALLKTWIDEGLTWK